MRALRHGGASAGAVSAALALAAALILAVPGSALAGPGGHGHHGGGGGGGGRVGLLIADHGEPPLYNEDTYWSFRRFFEHLMEMGLIPAELKLLDGGTVLQDRDCYGCAKPSPDGQLIDAWLHPQDGPAAPVPALSDDLAAHYLMPTGPGLGEPDIFEHIGLAAWHEWELMGGRSPNYDQKLPKKRAVIRRVHNRFGERFPVRVGYGIDPRIGGRRQGIARAVTALIRRDRVKRIVMAYHGPGFSDIMQTHMLRHEVEERAGELDRSVSISYAGQMGLTRPYVRAVVQKAEAELHRLPPGARPAIHLSGHGLPTEMCGEYDCGADAYHEFSARMFERTSWAIKRALRHHRGLGVFHLYGEGATDEDDPDDLVDSPLEALEKRKRAGFTHVIDIPYEFDSDSRDTLIVLRRGYERPIPDWNRRYDSRFRRQGLRVKITNASFGSKLKTLAFENVAVQAIKAASAGR